MTAPAKPTVDTEALKTHLANEWGPISCQMCHKGQWAVGDTTFELREFFGGGLRIDTGLIIPVIPVTCSNCGRTVLINTIVAGVLKKDGEEKSDG